MTTQSSPLLDRRAVEISLLIVRVVAGIIFVVHGWPKVFGGGAAQMAGMLGLLAWPVAIGEFFGGLGLILGVLSRFSAASLIVIMLGAIAMVHGKNGFLLSNQGFEYNFALIGLMLPTLLAGPGSFTIGRYLPLPKTSAGRPIAVLE
jgi:putative oxidoreductase